MNYKYHSQDDKSKSKQNKEDYSNRTYACLPDNSSNITVEELIENIRGKIQRKLDEKAKTRGRRGG